MEKEKEKFKISVRLNGKEQSYEEISAAREKSEPQEVESVDKIEQESSSKIIDFVKRQKEKNQPTPPYWDDGNHKKIPKLPFNKKRKKKRKGAFPFSLKKLPLTIIVASIAAIIVGISLGITMLTLLTGSDENVASVGGPSISAAVSSDRFQDMKIDFVQGGAFSTYETGREMATSFQNRGQAGVLAASSENYYLFIGLGTNRAEADQVSLLYKQNGHDTYVKAHAVPGIASPLDSDFTLFINEGVTLHEGLTRATVSALSSAPINVAQLIVEAESWYKNQVVIDKLEGETKGKAAEFATQVKQAAEHIHEYQQSTDDASLWKAQQKLLEAVIAYEQLVNEFR